MKYSLLSLICFILNSVAFSQSFSIGEFESLYQLKSLNERIDFIKKKGFTVDSSYIIDSRIKAINFSNKSEKNEFITLYDYPDQDVFTYWMNDLSVEAYYYPLLSNAYKSFPKETFPKYPNNYRQRFMKTDKKKKTTFFIEVTRSAVDNNLKGFYISYGSNFND